MPIVKVKFYSYVLYCMIISASINVRENDYIELAVVFPSSDLDIVQHHTAMKALHS